MDKESKEFLKELLNTNGPSGFEEQTQAVWKQRTAKFSDKITTDIMGNTTAILNPEGSFKIMLAGHIDEIGLIITHIDEQGFIYVEAIGGVDKVVVPGSHVIIMTDMLDIEGVIGKKAIHLDEDKKAIDIKDIYIDVGGVDDRIKVGDPVAFKPNYLELTSDIFSSKACDDRTGAFVVSEVIKMLSKQTHLLSLMNISVHAVATVQEEVGLRGARTSAFSIKPNLGFAVDVTFSSDTPDSNKKELGDVQLGKGPVLHSGPANNRKLLKLVKNTAELHEIDYQLQANGYPSGTDTASIQMSKEGVATVLISLPLRYMHTPVETCSSSDLMNTVKLIATTILELRHNKSFIPGNNNE